MPELISETARRAVGVAWRVHVETAPVALAYDVRHRMDTLSLDRVAAHDSRLLEFDKIFFVAIRRSEGFGARASVRELDRRTQRWGPIVERVIRQPLRVGPDAARAVIDCSAPLARIEKVDDDRALLQLRAGLLIDNGESAASLPVGALLRPVVRRNDAYGKPIPDGVQALPWTVLEVQSDRGGGQLVCLVHSGLAYPLGTRRSRRIEQLAIGIHSLGGSTRLHLVSRSQPDRPLPGYDLYARDRESEHLTLLGRSDWRGSIEIGPGPAPLRILFARGGEELLARLPLVPGEQPAVTAALPDDARRVEAEAFVLGLEQQLMDTVARRTLLVRAFEQRASNGQPREANQLLQQLRTLPTREDLLRQLRTQKQTFVTEDSQVQRKIDRLFDQLERRLYKHLDPRELDALGESLEGSTNTTMVR